MNIFWDTSFIIIEKDGTERPATALEETWIERAKKHHECEKNTKFKQIGGILNEYECVKCNKKI